jgi:MrcB-like, N-terminal domain
LTSFELTGKRLRATEQGRRLARFLELYASARQEPFGADHEASEALRAAATALAQRLRTTLPQAKVKPSVGQGNWARVPWIAVLDRRETDSTQHGTYPVILIPENLDGVYLTLAQGVTELKQQRGRRDAYDEMRRRAEVLRPQLTSLLDRGFEFEGDVQLGDSPYGRDYAASVVASKYAPVGELAHSPIEDDMVHLGAVYEDLLARGALRFEEDAVTGPQVLCIYLGRGASTNFETGGRNGWWGWRSAPTGLESLRPGDLVLFGRGYSGGSPRVDSDTWQAGALDSVVVGRLEEPPGAHGRDGHAGRACRRGQLSLEVQVLLVGRTLLGTTPSGERALCSCFRRRPKKCDRSRARAVGADRRVSSTGALPGWCGGRCHEVQGDVGVSSRVVLG